MVQAVAYSNFRKELKSYMRKVSDDADTILVTNQDPDENIIVMGADDYDSLMETLRIYQNKYLYSKISRGLDSVRQGKTEHHSLMGE